MKTILYNIETEQIYKTVEGEYLIDGESATVTYPYVKLTDITAPKPEYDPNTQKVESETEIDLENKTYEIVYTVYNLSPAEIEEIKKRNIEFDKLYVDVLEIDFDGMTPITILYTSLKGVDIYVNDEVFYTEINEDYEAILEYIPKSPEPLFIKVGEKSIIIKVNLTTAGIAELPFENALLVASTILEVNRGKHEISGFLYDQQVQGQDVIILTDEESSQGKLNAGYVKALNESRVDGSVWKFENINGNTLILPLSNSELISICDFVFDKIQNSYDLTSQIYFQMLGCGDSSTLKQEIDNGNINLNPWGV